MKKKSLIALGEKKKRRSFTSDVSRATETLIAGKLHGGNSGSAARDIYQFWELNRLIHENLFLRYLFGVIKWVTILDEDNFEGLVIRFSLIFVRSIRALFR